MGGGEIGRNENCVLYLNDLKFNGEIKLKEGL